MLADCYRRGRGAKKDLEKSRRYAQFAADRGDERGKKVLQRLDGNPPAKLQADHHELKELQH